MWLAAGCPLRQERRTNYFSLSFIRKSDLSSSGKCNYQATVSFLFWQVVLYSTQAWGKVLMVQHRNLHAFLNMNIHLISNLNDGTQKKLLFPPPMHISQKQVLIVNTFCIKTTAAKHIQGKPCPIQHSLWKQTPANLSYPWLSLCICVYPSLRAQIC